MPEAMIRDIFGDPRKVLSSDRNPEVQYLAASAAGRELPRIYMACGTEDQLLEANRAFASFLRQRGADHRYEEGPGAHNWRFWNEYVVRGLDWLFE